MFFGSLDGHNGKGRVVNAAAFIKINENAAAFIKIKVNAAAVYSN